MISQFTKILGGEGVNIGGYDNKMRASMPILLLIWRTPVSREALEELRAVEGVSKVRVVK